MKNIELSDLGRIAGQDGVWCVIAGAVLPPNVEAVSESAIASATYAYVLTCYQPDGNGGTRTVKCKRSEWTPL